MELGARSRLGLGGHARKNMERVLAGCLACSLALMGVLLPEDGHAQGTEEAAASAEEAQPAADELDSTLSRASNPYDIALAAPLAADAASLTVNVTTTDPDYAGKAINVVRFAPVLSDGTLDTGYGNPSKYMNALGPVVLDMSGATLTPGQAFRIYLVVDGEEFLSDEFTVLAPVEEDRVLLEGVSVTPETTSLTVNVSGCANMVGGRLFLTRGSAATDDDADSRRQMGSQTFTGAGSYTFEIDPSVLSAGQTVLAHLYKYDSDADTTLYVYGNSLPFVDNAVSDPKDARIEIVTSNVTADRTDLWLIADYAGSSNATLTLHCVDRATFAANGAAALTADNAIASKAVSPSEQSQRIGFASGSLQVGKVLVAKLAFADGSAAVSDSVEIQAAPQKQQPVARIIDGRVTAGMTGVTASLSFDASFDEATYKLYRFAAGDEVDIAASTPLASATLYRPSLRQSIYLGPGKLAAGDRLVLVLEVGGMTAVSEMMEVEPSPDWGTPYVALSQPAVAPNASSVLVSVDYADEYVAMGDDFYCDVSVYQAPGTYSDQEIEDGELWENTVLCKRVGQLNSNYGEETRGQLEVALRDDVELEPGSRLFVKLRLPHVEWAGEEVDYVSASIPVLGEGEELPATKVLLYNLGPDTARGAQVRAMLAKLGVEAQTVSAADLGQTVGYLAGLAGYGATEGTDEGDAPSTEFMLLCGMGESLLDDFLDMMQAEGLRIDHKAIVTEYNREHTLRELMGDIASEHEIFQALLALDKLIATVHATVAAPPSPVDVADMAALQDALARAEEVLSSHEPTLDDLQTSLMALQSAHNKVLGVADGPERPGVPNQPSQPDNPSNGERPNHPSGPNSGEPSAQPEDPTDPKAPELTASVGQPHGSDGGEAATPSAVAKGKTLPRTDDAAPMEAEGLLALGVVAGVLALLARRRLFALRLEAARHAR